MTEPFFRNYTRLVSETDLVATLRQQLQVELEPWLNLENAIGPVIHPPYTWSISQVMGHMVDTELVFAYRAFRFSRQDPTPLAGFDEGLYVACGGYEKRSLRSIVQQLILVRQCTICQFETMPNEAWAYRGTASDLEWSVTDLAQAIIGHVRHHRKIILKRLSM